MLFLNMFVKLPAMRDVYHLLNLRKSQKYCPLIDWSDDEDSTSGRDA